MYQPGTNANARGEVGHRISLVALCLLLLTLALACAQQQELKTPIPGTPPATAAANTPTPAPASTSTPSPAVTYIEGRFKSGSAVGKEITVPEGASVGVQVVLDAAGNTSGGLKVEVWKRIALSPDISVRTCDGAAALVKGTQAVYSCDFVPDDLTSRRFTHYYLKAYWDGVPLTVEPRIREGIRTVPGQTATTPTPSPSKEWNLEGIQVDSSTVTVLLRVFAGIDVRVTLDGTPADEVRPVLPIMEHVFLNVTRGQHMVEVRDVMGHEVKAEVAVATSGATPGEHPQ